MLSNTTFDDVVRSWREAQGEPSPSSTMRWRSKMRHELETEPAGVGTGFLWTAAAVLLLGLHLGAAGAWAASFRVDDPVRLVAAESSMPERAPQSYARYLQVVTQTANGS